MDVKRLCEWLAKGWDGIDKHETLKAVMYDDNMKFIFARTICVGDAYGCNVDIGDILRAAIGMRASAVVVAHNHPSGSSNPSPADNQFTSRLWKACKSCGLSMVDHLILTESSGYYSYAEHGALQPKFNIESA